MGRRNHAQRIGKMRRLADANKFDKAMDELAEAKNALRTASASPRRRRHANALPRMLKYARQADEFHRNPNAAHI
ncbi:hypothetical protein U9M48_001290 [Paspalum notatum var. saurae]|uniref:Uncharacterized protein n=1 Tax=Paspalum notatum var. saurae TaxID=547442 RepID=A0AAQ3PNE8_PASNO